MSGSCDVRWCCLPYLMDTTARPRAPQPRATYSGGCRNHTRSSSARNAARPAEVRPNTGEKISPERISPRPPDDGNPLRIEPPPTTGESRNGTERFPGLRMPRIVPSNRRSEVRRSLFSGDRRWASLKKNPLGGPERRILAESWRWLYWGQRGRMTPRIGADEGDLDEARIADGPRCSGAPLSARADPSHISAHRTRTQANLRS